MKSEFIELSKFNKSDFDSFVLGGDVGGTNTTLAVSGVKGKDVKPLFALKFKSQDLSGITEAINETLKIAHKKFDITLSKACLSPAGPISANGHHCRLTNASWSIDAKEVLSATMLESVCLVNDFTAVGFGLEFMSKADLVELSHPDKKHTEPVPKAPKGILGAGTGLGKSLMFFDENKECYIPHGSEGGNEDMAVDDSFEYELAQFVKDQRGGEAPCRYEDVVSGNGLVKIYDFLLEMEVFDRNDWTKDIEDAPDRATAISKHSKKCPICKKSFEIFVRFYARALRNMALAILPRGGLYLAGGIAGKNIDFFKDGKFMHEFEINYAYHDLLKEFPVFVITNYNVSLFGTANVAANFPELAVKK